MEPQPQVNFKVSCTSDLDVLRRLNFAKISDLTYSSLYSKLSGLFKLDNFKIRYKDEDGDAISIDNDSDLKEAIDHFLNLDRKSDKVLIRLSLEPVSNDQEKEFPDISNGNSNENNKKIVAGDKSSAASQIDDSQSSSSEFGTNNEYANPEEHPFEKVLNTGIKNLQDMVQTFVTQLSSTIELNKNINVSQLHQSNIDDNSHNINSNDSPITNSSSEARQIPKVEVPNTSEPVVHFGVLCDCCQNIIRGMRWKCTTCKDYDLCQVCKSKPPNILHHPNDHLFRPIPYPRTSNHTPHSENVHSATCDYCESVIHGTRHKCINCPDFDLCSNCILLAPTQHPNHTFMSIYKPGEPEVKIQDAAFHPGIRCDGCHKAINGVRFKCGNCPDFDLCGNCEASPLNKHDPNHVFIKLKRPVPSPLSSTKPLLPLLYSRADIKSCKSKIESKQKPASNEMESTTNNSIVEVGSSSITSQAASQKQPISIVRVPSDTIVSRAPIDLYKPSNNYITSSENPQPQNDSSSPASSSHSIFSVQPQDPLPEMSSKPPQSISSNNTDHADSNNFFTPLFLKRPSVEPAPVLNSCFVEDVNVPDGTVLVPQAQFLKIWKLSNNGTVAWPESTALQFVCGHRMFNDALIKSGEEGIAPTIPVGTVEVGKTVCISADLQAPSEPGKYTSYWRLTDIEGNQFGHRVWCEIEVEAADQSSSMSASSMIFPVLNYDQRSVSARSNGTSVPVSLEIEKLQNEDNDSFCDPISPGSPFSELHSNRTLEIESQSDYDSDGSDDSDSSSADSSQSFFIVDKVSDDDMQMQRGRSVLINQSSNENEAINNTQAEEDIVASQPVVIDEPKLSKEIPENLKYKEALDSLFEMGFCNKEKCLQLLEKYDGDLTKIIENLV